MLRTIEQAKKSIVTLEETKRHLRIEHTEEDADIQRLIETAEAHIKNQIRASLHEETLEYTVESPKGEVELPNGPVHDVIEVYQGDSNGNEQAVMFRVIGDRVIHRAGKCAYLRIEYQAKMNPIPKPVQQACLLYVDHLYENREVVTDAPQQEIQQSFHALLAPYRRGWF